MTCPTLGASCYSPAVGLNAGIGCDIAVSGSGACINPDATNRGTCYSQASSPIGAALQGNVAASISTFSTAGDAVTITAGVLPASSVDGDCTGFVASSGTGTSVTCPNVQQGGASCDLPTISLNFASSQPSVQFAFRVNCPDVGGCALISNSAISPNFQVCTQDDVTTTTSLTTTRTAATTTTRTTTRPMTTTSAVVAPTTRTTVSVTTRPASGSSLVAGLALIFLLVL